MPVPKLTSPSVLKGILQQHNIRLSKRYGQNFLCDEHIVDRIVSATGSGNNLLEIGPGVGTLTLALARQAHWLAAVEIDDRLIPILETHFEDSANIQLIHADILDVNFEVLAKTLGTPFDVVGNLPYQITSPLLGKIVESRHLINQGVVMVQKELAEKVLAPVGSGKGSSLGIFLQAFTEAEHLFNVPKTVFFPRPKVDSTVFRFRFLDQPRFEADEKSFFSVVRSAFNLRRKTLRQALIQSPFLKLDAEKADQVLTSAEIDSKRRGETLTLEEFDRIAQQL